MPSISVFQQLLLVMLGGALGTAARSALVLHDSAGALTVPLINLVGSALLGLITGALSARATGARGRGLQLLLGTGMLGGFTTYSSFAVAAATGDSLWLVLGTMLGGVLLGWLGLILGGAIAKPRRE